MFHTAKIRISEQNTKGKYVFLCIFERNYLHRKVKVMNFSRNIQKIIEKSKIIRTFARDLQWMTSDIFKA